MEIKNNHQKNIKNSKKNEGLKIRASTGDIIVLGGTIIAAAIGAAFVAHRGRSSGNNNNKGRERRKNDEERVLQSLLHLGKEESSIDSLMENKGKERLSIEFQGEEESEKGEDGLEGWGDSSIESSNETVWPAEVIEQEKKILTDLNEMKNQQGEGDESLGMGIQSVLPCKTNNDHGDEEFAFGNSVEILEINHIETVENPLEVNTNVGDFSFWSNKQNTPQGQTEQYIEESDIAVVTKNELLDEVEVEKKEISETNEIKQQWEIPENIGDIFASECENDTGVLQNLLASSYCIEQQNGQVSVDSSEGTKEEDDLATTSQEVKEFQIEDVGARGGEESEGSRNCLEVSSDQSICLEDIIELEKMDDSMSTNEMNDQLDIPRKVEAMNGSADGYTNYDNNPVQESSYNGVEFNTLDKEASENLEDLKIAHIEVDLVEKEGDGEEAGDQNAHIEVVENEEEEKGGDGFAHLNVEVIGGDDITNIAVEAIEKDENGGDGITIEVENEVRGEDITHIEVEEEQQQQKGDGITDTKAVLEGEVGGGEEDINHIEVEVVKEEVEEGKYEKEENQGEGIAHIEVKGAKVVEAKEERGEDANAHVEVKVVEEVEVEQKGGDDIVYTEAIVRAEEAEEEEKGDYVTHIEMKEEKEDDNVHKEVDAVEVKADEKGDDITHIEGLKEEEEEKREDGEQESSSLKSPEKEIKSPVEEENETQESIRTENTSMEFNGKEVCTAEEVELENYLEPMYELKQSLETPEKINQIVGIASAKGDKNTNGGIQSFLPYNDKNIEVPVDISLAIQEKDYINLDIETESQQTCKNFEMAMETGESMSVANIDHGNNVMKECSFSNGISNFSQDENKQDLQEPDISHVVEEEDQSHIEGDDITKKVEAIEKDENGDSTAIEVENGAGGDGITHMEVEDEQQQQKGDGITHTKAVLEGEVGGGEEDINHIEVEVVKEEVEEGKEEKEEYQGEGIARIEVKGAKVVEAKEGRGEHANAHVEVKVVEEVEVVEVEQKGGDDNIYTEAIVRAEEAEEEKGDYVAHIEMKEEKEDDNVHKEVDAVEEEVKADEKGDDITHIEGLKEEEEGEREDGEQESSSLKSPEKEIKSTVEEENETQESIRTENTSMEFNGKEVCTAEEVELENYLAPMYELKQSLETPEKINQIVGIASAKGDKNTNGGIQSFLPYNDKNMEVPVDISLAIQEKDHINLDIETESQQTCKNFEMAMETGESMSVANIDHGNNVMKECSFSDGISNFSQDENKQALQEPDISHVVEEEDQSRTEGDDITKVEAIEKDENGDSTAIEVENGAGGDGITHIEVEEQQQQKGDGITHTKAVLEDEVGGGEEDITHTEVEVEKEEVEEGKEQKEKIQGEGIAHIEKGVKPVEGKEERGEDANAHVEVVGEVEVVEVEQKGDDIVYTQGKVTTEEAEEEEKGDCVALIEMEEEKGDDNVHKDGDAVEEVNTDEKEGDDITHIEVLKEEDEENREDGEQESSSLKSAEIEIKSPVEEENEMQESIRIENTSMDFNGKEVCTAEKVELENHLEPMYEMKQNLEIPEKINQIVGIASAQGGKNTYGGIQSFLLYNHKNIEVPVDISLAIQGKDCINLDMETKSQQTCKNFEMAMETDESTSVANIGHGNNVMKECLYSDGISNFSQDENKQDLQEPDISHVVEDQSPTEAETELYTEKDGESAKDESEETRISSMMTIAETISQTKIAEEEKRLPFIENEMKLQSEIPKKTTDIVYVAQVEQNKEEHEQKANKESEIIVTSKEKKMDLILTGHSKGLFFFMLVLALALGLLALTHHDQLRIYNHHLPKIFCQLYRFFFPSYNGALGEF